MIQASRIHEQISQCLIGFSSAMRMVQAEKRAIVVSDVCRPCITFKMNTPKMVCVTIRPSLNYLSTPPVMMDNAVISMYSRSNRNLGGFDVYVC